MSVVFLLSEAIVRLCTCVPLLVTASFTSPAGALITAGVILNSDRVTATGAAEVLTDVDARLSLVETTTRPRAASRKAPTAMNVAMVAPPRDGSRWAGTGMAGLL